MDISVVPADVADRGHVGTIEFDLEVLEWLTEDGPSEFTAEVSAGSICTYLHREDREAALTALSIGLKISWERAGEAILFLEDLKTQPYSLGYLGQIDNRGLAKHKFSEPILLWNMTWLPKVPNEDKYLVHAVAPYVEGPEYTVSLDEIREAATRITEELSRNDSEEYLECVRSKYKQQRYDRFLRQKYPDRTTTMRTTKLTVAAPGIVQFSAYVTQTSGVGIGGPDAELFRIDRSSDNQDYVFTSTQPLSEGAYEIHIQYNHEAHALCGQKLVTDKWFITVPPAESGDM